METQNREFSVNVRGVKGLCPTGEAYAAEQIDSKRTPVLTCEGPCIRGEIARRAGNLVSRDLPSLARACHGEAFYVPHSLMASWVTNAEKVVMIDGCFLQCHGRILKTLVPEDRVVHIDALPLYKKYTDVFLMDDVPEEELKAAARDVADSIIGILNGANHTSGASDRSAGSSPAK